MAYGKNQARKDWLHRAVPLHIAPISQKKRARLGTLREAVLGLMRRMAVAGFSPEPLDENRRGKSLDAVLLTLQKDPALAKTLNSVWREQARMRVKPALEEANARYFRYLSGCLRHLDQEIPPEQREGDSTRRWYHIPESVQDTVTPEEIADLKRVGEAGDAIGLFRQWRAGFAAVSPHQAEILADIHRRAQARHTCPNFGAGADFTLQLHVDLRMLPSSDPTPGLALREDAARLLCDPGNRLYHRFIDLAGVAPRERRIRVPLAVTPKLAKRLDGAASDWAALIVELSAEHIGVRLVGGQPPPEAPSEARTFVGRDFGYANTVSLSVARAAQPVGLEALREQLAALDSAEAAAAFLTARAVPPSVEILERVRFEGRAFLARVNTLCERIDATKSRIDLAYNQLFALKGALVSDLGLAPDAQITPALKRRDPRAREFFRLLGQIKDLKRARRRHYAKIKAIKQAWFGFLANTELRLAQRHQAVVVRERLSVVAIETEAPDYKGRTFNKMLNNGARGQYQRRATQTLSWNGVPELVVPSWYTSRACLRHSEIVDAKHRRGETIFLPCCNAHDHADEHAADTLASYPFLVPKHPQRLASRPDAAC